MKKTYQNPAMEMISLMNEDILTVSGADSVDVAGIKSIDFGNLFG